MLIDIHKQVSEPSWYSTLGIKISVIKSGIKEEKNEGSWFTLEATLGYVRSLCSQLRECCNRKR